MGIDWTGRKTDGKRQTDKLIDRQTSRQTKENL
jgi:hypothetical protein